MYPRTSPHSPTLLIIAPVRSTLIYRIQKQQSSECPRPATFPASEHKHWTPTSTGRFRSSACQLLTHVQKETPLNGSIPTPCHLLPSHIHVGSTVTTLPSAPDMARIQHARYPQPSALGDAVPYQKRRGVHRYLYKVRDNLHTSNTVAPPSALSTSDSNLVYRNARTQPQSSTCNHRP